MLLVHITKSSFYLEYVFIFILRPSAGVKAQELDDLDGIGESADADFTHMWCTHRFTLANLTKEQVLRSTSDGLIL